MVEGLMLNERPARQVGVFLYLIKRKLKRGKNASEASKIEIR